MTFKLFPEDGLSVSQYKIPYRHIFRAILMKWVHEIKPELFQEYHETKNRKKYTIRCIVPKNDPKIMFIIISYDTLLSKALEDDVLFRNKNSLKVGDKKFKITNITKEKLELNELIENSKPKF